LSKAISTAGSHAKHRADSGKRTETLQDINFGFGIFQALQIASQLLLTGHITSLRRLFAFLRDNE
jgi:hypothetical protein